MALKVSPKIKKILSIVGNILLVILIMVGILIAFSLLPIKNNYKILAVTSGSMEPAVGVGSLAIIKPASDYKVLDIITYKKAGADDDKDTTTHRIAEVIEGEDGVFYRTKGDANNTADSALVSEDQVVGKYYFNIALIGYLIKYIKTLPGLILIIIIPATIIIYEEAKKMGREMRRIKKETAQKKLNKSPQKEKK